MFVDKMEFFIKNLSTKKTEIQKASMEMFTKYLRKEKLLLSTQPLLGQRRDVVTIHFMKPRLP